MINKVTTYRALLLIIFVSSVSCYSQRNKFYNAELFEANNILLPLNNIGGLDGYFSFPYFESKWQYKNYDGPIVYSQGLWITGKSNNQPILAFAQWLSTFTPGPIINGKPAQLVTKQDSLKYRIYKISIDDNLDDNPDLTEWPVDLGAPADSKGNPIIFGDQSLFSIYNSADTSNYYLKRIMERDSLMRPTSFEIRQLSYGYGRYYAYNILSNIVFFEWEIINKGNEKIDSTFIGIWSDIDFFYTSENIPGYDKNLELGYCWSRIDTNRNSPDEFPAPAVGYTLLYGPAIPKQGSNGYYKGKLKNDVYNLPVYSFHAIADNAAVGPLLGSAGKVTDAWCYARALNFDGTPTIDDSTGLPTRFPFSGDPATDSGWVYKGNVGGGSGMVIFTGPFDFAPGDTQWVMAALIPALGKDKFDSIEQMRLNAKTLRSIPYENLIDKTVIKIKDDEAKPQYFSLSRNYPNPFNNTTKIRYTIPDAEIFLNVPVSLKVYNILGQEVANLVDKKQNPGLYEVIFDGANLSSGVYFYKLVIVQFTSNKKMIFIK